MQKNQKLKEGKDFYFNEQGFVVLTAAFLKKRGFCCHNGCRHCPYPDCDCHKQRLKASSENKK